MSEPIRCASECGGEIERMVLDRPRGNILDLVMLGAIRRRLAEIAETREPLKLLVFEGAGGHFSFGASVEEHLPGRVAELLPAFHQLFWDLEVLAVPTAAVVRGQCLGGAFELALWCGLVVCDPTARFGLPETRLGVFPPMAALALPWRTTGARSVQMILSGEILDATTAVGFGLADLCDDDPEAALQRWFERSLAAKSAVAVRKAWRAARRPLWDALRNDLAALERLYLRDLMAHRDPVEGITAFVEKREPVWTHQ